MNNLKQFLPTYTLRTMYNSQILPHVNVSILSWGLHTSRLSKLQKRAVRIITRNKYNVHTEPILKYIGLLKVNDIFTLQCLKFYFKCTHVRAPILFASFFTRNTARHDHNTRQRHQPEIIFSHTSRARKCIKFHIPLLLRSMPTCIIDTIYTHSLNGFSNYTKQYMLAGYENICQTRNCYVCAHAKAVMSVFITIIHILYVFISCNVYRLFCFTSRNCIRTCLLCCFAYAHVSYSPMFLVLSVDVCIIVNYGIS